MSKTYVGYFDNPELALEEFNNYFKVFPGTGISSNLNIRPFGCFQGFWGNGLLESNLDRFYFSIDVESICRDFINQFNREFNNIKIEVYESRLPAFPIFHIVYNNYSNFFKGYANYLIHHMIRMFNISEDWSSELNYEKIILESKGEIDYFELICKVNNNFHSKYRTLYEGVISKPKLLKLDRVTKEFENKYKLVLNDFTTFTQTGVIKFIKKSEKAFKSENDSLRDSYVPILKDYVKCKDIKNPYTVCNEKMILGQVVQVDFKQKNMVIKIVKHTNKPYVEILANVSPKYFYKVTDEELQQCLAN